mgnify:FL=1
MEVECSTAFVGSLRMDHAILRKRLIAPKMVSKKRPFSRITQEKGRSQALFSPGRTSISSSQRST